MLEHLKDFIARHTWTYAKTMPSCPHNYIVRSKVDSDKSFVGLLNLIRSHGYDEQWYHHNHRYLDIGDYKYWTMGYTEDVTVIINRAKLNWVNKPIRRNKVKFIPKEYNEADAAKYRNMRGGIL